MCLPTKQSTAAIASMKSITRQDYAESLRRLGSCLEEVCPNASFFLQLEASAFDPIPERKPNTVTLYRNVHTGEITSEDMGTMMSWKAIKVEVLE